MRKAAGEILWLAVLIAFAAIMGTLLISGNILLYLAPRMVPMVWFGLAVFIILAGYQATVVLRAWRERDRSKGVRLYALAFLVPLVLFLTVTPDENTSNALPNQNVQLLGMQSGDGAVRTEPSATTAPGLNPKVSPKLTPEPKQTASPSPTPDESPQATPAAPSGETPAVPQTIDIEAALPCVLNSETVPFNAAADQFGSCMYQSVEELAGQTVTLYGFVYKDKAFPANTMLVSRMLISCCAADASLVGFHARVENADKFKAGDWVCVTGEVAAMSIEYEGASYNFPVLVKGTLSRCETPSTEDAYVYP